MSARRSRPGEFPKLHPRDVVRGGSVTLWRNPADRVFGERDAVTIESKWKTLGALPDAYARVREKEAKLAAKQSFAWSSTFGYLSPDPFHCGTGMGVMGEFHLEGLHLIGDLPAVLAGISAVRFMANGVAIDGISQAAHDFAVSNDATLGVVEDDLLERASRLFDALVEQELLARKALVYDTPRILLDAVSRSLALLRNARLLAPGEVYDMLSPVLLASSMGFIDGISRREVVELMEMQLDMPELPPPETVEDDRVRDARDSDAADWFNERFASVSLNALGEEFLE